MTDQTNSTLVTYLKNNPRMMGVLFTICLLLMEASNVALASGGSAHNGP